MSKCCVCRRPGQGVCQCARCVCAVCAYVACSCACRAGSGGTCPTEVGALLGIQLGGAGDATSAVWRLRDHFVCVGTSSWPWASVVYSLTTARRGSRFGVAPGECASLWVRTQCSLDILMELGSALSMAPSLPPASHHPHSAPHHPHSVPHHPPTVPPRGRAGSSVPSGSVLRGRQSRGDCGGVCGPGRLSGGGPAEPSVGAVPTVPGAAGLTLPTPPAATGHWARGKRAVLRAWPCWCVSVRASLRV
jgi:hypothetical protein